MQDAAGIDPADRAAARAERHDVEAVQGDAVAADLAVGGERRLAVDDEADIGARAAHVEGDEIALADQLGGVTAAGDAAGWARQHAAGSEARGLDDRCDAAMRLNDEDRTLVARLDETLGE